MLIIGNASNTILTPPSIQEREVAVVQSNSVAFKRPDGKLTWLHWPKAKMIQFPDDNTAVIMDENNPTEKLMTYKFL